MTQRPPMIRTSTQVTVIIGGRPLSATTGHPNFGTICQAIDEQRWADLEALFDIKTAAVAWSKGNFQITEDSVLFKGERLPSVIERKVLAFYADNQPVDALLAFFERVSKNPSSRAVNELYTFLEHKNIPIDEEGYFYAYKAIRGDWMDIYSGTVDNSIGAKPFMARNQVDDNCNNHCSRGYHVGSMDYVRWYGTGVDRKFVICKVDPAHVVSVPLDHSCQKVRVEGYEVVSEFSGLLPETTYRPVTDDDLEEEFDEDWTDETDLWAEREELDAEIAALEDELAAVRAERDELG